MSDIGYVVAIVSKSVLIVSEFKDHILAMTYQLRQYWEIELELLDSVL
jgi:hypothetical protein